MRILADKAIDGAEVYKAKFHEIHQKGVYIGSSRIAAIAGLSRFETPLAVWCKMTGKVPADEENEYMWLGSKMEPVVGEMFARKTGKVVLPAVQIVQHDSIDWAIASPDFFVTEGESKIGILETKTSTINNLHAWEDRIPDLAHCQLQWQLGIYNGGNIDKGFVAALIAGDPRHFKHFELPRDDSVFDQLVELAQQFMIKVQADIPPGAGSGDTDLIKALCKDIDEGKHIALSPSYESTFTKLF
jgi:putative phage-type endonuclease